MNRDHFSSAERGVPFAACWRQQAKRCRFCNPGPDGGPAVTAAWSWTDTPDPRSVSPAPANGFPPVVPNSNPTALPLTLQRAARRGAVQRGVSFAPASAVEITGEETGQG